MYCNNFEYPTQSQKLNTLGRTLITITTVLTNTRSEITHNAVELFISSIQCHKVTVKIPTFGVLHSQCSEASSKLFERKRLANLQQLLLSKCQTKVNL